MRVGEQLLDEGGFARPEETSQDEYLRLGNLHPI